MNDAVLVFTFKLGLVVAEWLFVLLVGAYFAGEMVKWYQEVFGKRR